MTASGIEPGLLKLDLAVNKVHLCDRDKKQVNCKIELLKHYFDKSKGRPHRYAILNFIALLQYRLGDIDKAIVNLKETIDKDPGNVNALQDLATLYNKDYRKDDASILEKQLEHELGKLKERDSSDGSIVRARCHVGHALAWGFDIHVDTKGTHRLDQSVELYEKALHIADTLVSNSEKEDWLYYLALNYVRLNNVKQWSKNPLEYYQTTFQKAVESLVPNIVQSGDVIRQSAAWSLLGNLLAQRPRNNTESKVPVPQIIVHHNLRKHWRNPKECYVESRKLDKTNCVALNRLAHLYYEEKKEEDAINLLNESLQINSGLSNHHARRCRARIHRLKYNKLQRQGAKPDRNLLRLALDDLQHCADTNPYIVDMIHLAEVYHKLAWKENGEYDKESLCKALRWCTKAEMYQDGAMRPDLHQRRALVLQDLGDHDNAVKCFMQAMDSESPNRKDYRNFSYMYNGMVKRYKLEETKPNHLLQQLVYWLDEGMNKYSNTKIKARYFVKKSPKEMIRVVEALAKSRKKTQLDLALKCVKAFQDLRESDDISAEVFNDLGSTQSFKDLEIKLSEAIEQVIKETKTDSLKLDTGSVKDTFSESGSSPAASGTHDEGAPMEGSGRGTQKEKLSEGNLESISRPPFQSTPKTSQIHPRSPGVQLDDSSVTHAIPTSLSVKGSVVPTVATDASNVQDARGGMSPSSIPPASPDNTPLSRFINTPNAGGATPTNINENPMQMSQDPNPNMGSHATYLSSPETTPSMSHTMSSMSCGSTPSTAGSYKWQFQYHTPETPESPEKVGITSFTTTKEDFCYRKVMDALRRLLDETDLRPQDIGEPPKSALDPNYTYDFYAVYDKECQTTSDFVYYHLRSQLEEGKLPLKGCIPERDFIPGKAIIKNMTSAIENSAKILLLISTGFFENGWCEQALSSALLPQFKSKLVPILLDHVTLPLHLQSIHYIDARKTINWSVIRKHLEPPRCQSP